MDDSNLFVIEQKVISIYINCPELLFEEKYDKGIFEYYEHQAIYTAILKSLKGGEFNMAKYFEEVPSEILPYANNLESAFSSKSQLSNLLEPLKKRYLVKQAQTLVEQFSNGELSVHDVTNALDVLNIQLDETDFKATKVTYIEEKEPDWLIPGLIERNEITILGGDGGCGKTTVATNLMSALSSGRACFFEDDRIKRQKYKILYFSKEDGTAETLKKKFRLQNANMDNLYTFDLDDDRLQDVKLGTSKIESLVRTNRPDILVFDPLESFIDSALNMGARNQMRKISDSLRAICKKYKVTCFIIMHTNKESNVWGRKRLADSSDFWDASRSVLMFGETEEQGIHYIAHEKHNHCQRHDSILFTVNEDGIPIFDTFSEKSDREFVMSRLKEKSTSKLEEAMELFCSLLQDRDLTFEEIVSAFQEHNISQRTAERARTQLKKENKIESYVESLGKGKGTRCMYYLMA